MRFIFSTSSIVRSNVPNIVVVFVRFIILAATYISFICMLGRLQHGGSGGGHPLPSANGGEGGKI